MRKKMDETNARRAEELARAKRDAKAREEVRTVQLFSCDRG